LTDRLYDEFLLGVELVQAEQAGVLECLAGYHGLRRVLSEGLTPNGVAAFGEVVGVLREEGRDVAATVNDHAEVRGKSAEIDREVDEMVRDHRPRLLECGTPGLLAVRGEAEVLPLDEDDTLDAANPITRGGGVRIDRAKTEARHDSQVRLAVASGRCSVLVLGGSHELSAGVRNLGRSVEYVRVTTGRYREFAGRSRDPNALLLRVRLRRPAVDDVLEGRDEAAVVPLDEEAGQPHPVGLPRPERLVGVVPRRGPAVRAAPAALTGPGQARSLVLVGQRPLVRLVHSLSASCDSTVTIEGYHTSGNAQVIPAHPLGRSPLLSVGGRTDSRRGGQCGRHPKGTMPSWGRRK
jgi:hypothetical protein